MQRFNSSDQPRIRAIETPSGPMDDPPERAEGASISSMWRGTILDSIADGVFTVDDSWRITSFNSAAERITGYDRQEVIGRPCYEVFRASICRSSCALRRTMDTGSPIVNVPVEAVGKDGTLLPLSVSTAILRAPDGHRVGGVETFRDMSTVEALQQGTSDQKELVDLVGRHPAIQRIVDILPDIARSDAPVLVEGPAGSGKTLLSRTLHALSSRRDRPCIRVCCSALPERLLEHELFGGRDENGRDHVGRVRLAQGGTLVLDDVESLMPALQLEVLRLVQDQVFEPRGGAKTRAEVRVVVCASVSLSELVASGSFRQDLYYRLSVVRVALPSLSDRREDIPCLVDRFLSRHRLRTGKSIRGVTEEAMSLLVRYDYPGNVRELENAIEHAFVLCRGEIIESKHLPESVTQPHGNFHVSEPTAVANPRQAAEAEVIRLALERHRGNRLAAARELDMHRTTLWRKLKQYGIKGGY